MGKFRILALDGGGIRGVLTLYLLKRLEVVLGVEHIGQCFDLIAGTSTGGIIAGMLCLPDSRGKPRYSAKEAFEMYMTQGPEIFHQTWWHYLRSMGGLISEKYPTENLEKIIEDETGPIYLKDMAIPCLFTSYDMESRSPVVFSSIKAKKNSEDDFPISEVIRATSAAPTYFSPENIPSSGQCLIDGGMFANNPGMVAWSDALQHAIPQDIFLLSIGTGIDQQSKTYDEIRGYGDLQWASLAIQILIDSSVQANNLYLQRIFHSHGVLEQYLRIEPTLENVDPQMDDTRPENMQKLVDLGEQLFVRLANRGDLPRLRRYLVQRE